MFYDIFVRHAFGNLRDLLREISYSPMMGDYLTYSGSAQFDGFAFPDENYAREFMQLFTIGIFELDDEGVASTEETYDELDIECFARVWTGLDKRPIRPNVEYDRNRYWANYIDPMFVAPYKHDPFPKTALGGGYLGDGDPLCSDLPARPFLKRGLGTYEYRGHSTVFDDNDEYSWNNQAQAIAAHLELGADSALRAALCAADGAGACSFPSLVRLTEDLACAGLECDLDAVRNFRVVDAATNETVYYAYKPDACVEYAFFEGGRVMTPNRNNHLVEHTQCGDPAAVAAYPACCADATTRVRRVPGAARTLRVCSG